MKQSLFLLTALALGCAFAAEEVSPKVRAEENRRLVARYAKSVATVRYYFKRNAEGEEPDLRIPYQCPNCNSTHYRDSKSSVDEGIPAEFAGYVTGSDEVMIQDVAVPPEFLDRIEIVCGETVVPAEERAYCPDANALVLKTTAPLVGVEPLVFSDGGEPKEPRYFYIARDDGLLQSGVRTSNVAKFRHYVEPNVDLYEGNPNTLVLDESDAPVTLAFQTKIELGKEIFTPPSTWRREPATERFARRDRFVAGLAKRVLPVYLQLEAPPKESGRRSRSFSFSSSDDEVRGNDVDAVGVLCGEMLLVPVVLTPEQTARLVKLEATLPDGSKAPLAFVGSALDEGLLVAKFADGVPSALEPFACDDRSALAHFNTDLTAVFSRNLGGRLEVTMGPVSVGDFRLSKGNRICLDIGPSTVPKGVFPKKEWNEKRGTMLLVSDRGLVALVTKSRKSDRYSSERADLQGATLAQFLASPVYDPENVPREADDRKRLPYLGVEVERASPEILREKKAAAFFPGYRAESAAVVKSVAPNSPAAAIGIREGDVLLSAKRKGGDEVRLEAEYDYGLSINWEEIFGNDRFVDMFDGSATPWPNVEGGVNAVLAKSFSVGTEVVVTWVSEGRRREGTCRLALAPVHFQNAPKSRNKELGLTVCDMTAEVRQYFKFDESVPGVVVSKVKSGGVAAVAGLKPLELILEVNGKGVKSAKDFAEKVKDQKTLNFTVRRLTKSRMVPVSL